MQPCNALWADWPIIFGDVATYRDYTQSRAAAKEVSIT